MLVPYDDSMRLGMGYNSYTQSTCIDNAVRIAKNKDFPRIPSMGPSQKVTYSFKFVSNLSEIASAMNISYTSSIKKGNVQLAGSATQLDEKKIKQSDINAVISVKVINQTASVSEEHCEFKEIGLVNFGSESFNDIFGDSYVSGWIEGGEFNAVISMRVIDRSQTKTVTDSIMKDFSSTQTSNAKEFSSKLDQFSSGSVAGSALNRTEMTVSVSWMGGGQVKDPSTGWSIDSAYATAASFPAMVASCPQKTWAILTKYKANRSFREKALSAKVSPLNYELIGSYTAELFDNYMEYKQLINKVQDIMAAPATYTSQDTKIKPNAIPAKIPQLVAVRAAMRDEMTKIVTAVDVLTVDPSSLQRNLDSRRAKTPVDPLVKNILESVIGSETDPTGDLDHPSSKKDASEDSVNTSGSQRDSEVLPVNTYNDSGNLRANASGNSSGVPPANSDGGQASGTGETGSEGSADNTSPTSDDSSSGNTGNDNSNNGIGTGAGTDNPPPQPEPSDGQVDPVDDGQWQKDKGTRQPDPLNGKENDKGKVQPPAVVDSKPAKIDYAFQKLVAPEIWDDLLPVPATEISSEPTSGTTPAKPGGIPTFPDAPKYDKTPSQPRPVPLPRPASPKVILHIAIANFADVTETIRAAISPSQQIVVRSDPVRSYGNQPQSAPLDQGWLAMVYQYEGGPLRVMHAIADRARPWVYMTMYSRTTEYFERDNATGILDRSLGNLSWDKDAWSTIALLRGDELYETSASREAVAGQIRKSFDGGKGLRQVNLRDANSGDPWSGSSKTSLLFYRASPDGPIRAVADYGDGKPCLLLDEPFTGPGQPVAVPGTIPASSTSTCAWYNRGERVIFQDGDGHLQEAYRATDSVSWSVSRIVTSPDNSPRPNTSVAMVTWGSNDGRLYYINKNNRVVEKGWYYATGYSTGDGVALSVGIVHEQGHITAYKLRSGSVIRPSEEWIPEIGICYPNDKLVPEAQLYRPNSRWSIVAIGTVKSRAGSPLAAVGTGSKSVVFIFENEAGNVAAYTRAAGAEAWSAAEIPFKNTPSKNLSIAALAWPLNGEPWLKYGADASATELASDRLRVTFRTNTPDSKVYQQSHSTVAAELPESSWTASQAVGPQVGYVAGCAWTINGRVVYKNWALQQDTRRIEGRVVRDDGTWDEARDVLPFLKP